VSLEFQNMIEARYARQAVFWNLRLTTDDSRRAAEPPIVLPSRLVDCGSAAPWFYGVNRSFTALLAPTTRPPLNTTKA
jgi:hypothetical protein